MALKFVALSAITAVAVALPALPAEAALITTCSSDSLKPVSLAVVGPTEGCAGFYAGNQDGGNLTKRTNQKDAVHTLVVTMTALRPPSTI